VAATADDSAHEAASSVARCSTVDAEDCHAPELTSTVSVSDRDTVDATVIDAAASQAETASAAAAIVCTNAEADTLMTEPSKCQGRANLHEDTGQATALRSHTISSASASQLRHNLVDWSFDPFTADSLKKCRMIEAMFQTLGLSQVLAVSLHISIITICHRIRPSKCTLGRDSR
jgi:hypothetical protein